MTSVRAWTPLNLIAIFLLIKMAAHFCRIGAVPYVHPTKISNHHNPSSPLPWGIRGGSTISQEEKDTDDDSFYTSIGFQVVAGKADSLSGKSSLVQGGSTFMLLKDNNLLQPSTSSTSPESNSRIWNGDEIAVESLAIACDVMVLVVVVDSNSNTDDEGSYLDVPFTRALERGLKQRADSGMSSSLLVLLVSSSNETSLYDSKLSLEKDRLLLRDLSKISPNMVSSLDILSLEDPEESDTGLEITWKELLRENSAETSKTTSFLVEAEAFPLLLHDIYKAKGGRQTQFTAPLKLPLVTGEHSTEATESPVKAMKEDMNAVDVVSTGGTGATESPMTAMEEDINNVVDDVSMDGTESTPDEEQVSLEESTKEASGIVTSATEEATEDDEQQLHSILIKTQNQIHDLEAKQEQMWLGFSSDDLAETSWHMEFGPEMDRIIDQFQTSMQDQDQAKAILFTQILPHLKNIYEHHLQFLREQYGKQYEVALETTAENSPEEYQKGWKEAAGKITSSFREAAQSAIPIQCREGGQLRDADFDYVPILEGLLQDMMQATEEQEELLGISPEDDDNEEEAGDSGEATGKKRKGPAKWYHKIAAKAFVFGVNYFQGWLAYQGIKRAAAQRDLHLPKFPLF